MTWRVCCCWDVPPQSEVLAPLRAVARVDVVPAQRALLLSVIEDYDVYLATLHVQLDAPLIAAAKKLRMVATPSTGTDHVDLAELDRRDIAFYCIKTEYELLDAITSTAEMAWGLLLACMRRLPAAAASVHHGQWSRDRFRGHQLSGKTLGILGVGRLGMMMADYGRAFRMRVIGCDHHPRRALDHVEYVDFNTLLRESDVITIHIHLTPENTSLFDAAAFEEMKPGACIINTSRGAIIDEAALLDAMRSGKVTHAGLDVIDGEWRDDLVDHPLIRRAREDDRLVITPHLGGVTHEAQAMTQRFVAEKVAAMIRQRQQAENSA